MWLTGDLNVWLYSNPTDMRKSIDGLSIIISEKLSKNQRKHLEDYRKIK